MKASSEQFSVERKESGPSRRCWHGQRLATAVRGHWSIENSLHWVQDVMFNEDQSRIRKDHGPANFALLRRIAINVIKQDTSKGSVRKKRKRAAWKDDALRSNPRRRKLRCGCPVFCGRPGASYYNLWFVALGGRSRWDGKSSETPGPQGPCGRIRMEARIGQSRKVKRRSVSGTHAASMPE